MNLIKLHREISLVLEYKKKGKEKRNDDPPSLLQATLSLPSETHFDYDLGCKFRANVQGHASIGAGAANEHIYESK